MGGSNLIWKPELHISSIRFCSEVSLPLTQYNAFAAPNLADSDAFPFRCSVHLFLHLPVFCSYYQVWLAYKLDHCQPWRTTTTVSTRSNWENWTILTIFSPVIAINGNWPSPALRGKVNDTLEVTVHNELGNQSLSMHWHGIHMTGNNKDDGVPMVTQCPVIPGASYTYVIQVGLVLSCLTEKL